MFAGRTDHSISGMSTHRAFPRSMSISLPECLPRKSPARSNLGLNDAQTFHRTSTVTATNWRTQRAAVHSLTTSNALSTMSSVLTVPPPRDALSPFINRSSSLVFHPREMVYAVGSLDGSGGCRISPCQDPITDDGPFYSACVGLQVPVIDRATTAVSIIIRRYRIYTGISFCVAFLLRQARTFVKCT